MVRGPVCTLLDSVIANDSGAAAAAERERETGRGAMPCIPIGICAESTLAIVAEATTARENNRPTKPVVRRIDSRGSRA
jgi:hypothetical protein